MIRKVDGRRFLDSGTIVVVGDAVVEVEVNHRGKTHQIALKFRTDDKGPEVRFGNPQNDRTVVHFANFPFDTTSANGGVSIGKIAETSCGLPTLFNPLAKLRRVAFGN